MLCDQLIRRKKKSGVQKYAGRFFFCHFLNFESTFCTSLDREFYWFLLKMWSIISFSVQVYNQTNIPRLADANLSQPARNYPPFPSAAAGDLPPSSLVKTRSLASHDPIYGHVDCGTRRRNLNLATSDISAWSRHTSFPYVRLSITCW